jgi:hypothetical protein
VPGRVSGTHTLVETNRFVYLSLVKTAAPKSYPSTLQRFVDRGAMYLESDGQLERLTAFGVGSNEFVNSSRRESVLWLASLDGPHGLVRQRLIAELGPFG